jgi:hypothetical protein
MNISIFASSNVNINNPVLNQPATEPWVPISGFSNYEINKSDIRNKKTGRILKKSKSKNGYFKMNLVDDNKQKITKSFHRLLAEIYIDNPDNKKCVDHIDRNTENNSLDNLRWVSHSENMYNKSSSGKFGKGVVFDSGKFRARINQTHLGHYSLEDEAKYAYEFASKKMFGEFACYDETNLSDELKQIIENKVNKFLGWR